MPDSSPKHGAVWVRQLATELERRGHLADGLLGEAGLDRRMLSGEEARIPFSKHAAFFELAAEVLADRLLGLRFAQTRDARDAGLICYVGLASATVMDALRNLARYLRVFSDAVELDVARLGDRGQVRWYFHGIDARRSRQCIEFAVANVIRAMRVLSGRRFSLAQVTFAHVRNNGTSAFDAFFGCPVYFGADTNMMAMHLADLRLPTTTADERLLVILRRHCEDVLTRHPQRPPPLVERVERHVADRLASGEIRLATLASDLGMSSRSLSRKLAEQNTSLNAIIANLRRELALAYLRDGSVSLAEIAFLLGYSDVSTFNHAFKRWTGRTPSSFRAQ